MDPLTLETKFIQFYLRISLIQKGFPDSVTKLSEKRDWKKYDRSSKKRWYLQDLPSEVTIVN